MTRRRIARAASILLASAVALTAAVASAQDVPYQKRQLANGMTVILHEDHSLPVAVIHLYYGVGSKDEAPGRSGFAHLFEHLMFMGTERVPDNQFDVLMEKGGGSNNASTSYDRTDYYSQGPRELLPLLLWLDADRLEDLARTMTQEKLDLQREVVRNERRQSYENQPYGDAYLLIDQEMFPPGHPYHHPVIGSHSDLEAATVEDVVEFFETFYVPANTSLVIAGDFDPDEINPLVDRLFGTLPTRPLPAHASAEPVQLDTVKRLTVVDDVQLPRTSMIFHAPPLYAPGDAEMDLIAGTLAGGRSTRLEKRLVHDLQICVDVEAYQASRKLGSLFTINATCNPDADLSEVERIIDEELTLLRDRGPAAEELERVRNAYEHGTLRRLEGLLDRARALNGYEHYFGEPNSFARDLDRYRKATPSSVKSWARRVLTPDARLILRVVGESPRAERPEAMAAGRFTWPQPETFQLANGLTVHHWARRDLPLIDLRLVLPGGARADASGRAGQVRLALDMLDEGTGKRSATEFADALELLGADFSTSVQREHATVSLRSLGHNFSEALALWAEALSDPAFDPVEWDRVKSLHLKRLIQQEDDPSAVASTVSSRLLFGAEHPYGAPTAGLPDTIEAITLDDVAAVARSVVQPRGATLLTAGDLSRDELEAALSSALSGWGGDAPAPKLRPAPSAVRRPFQVALVHEPGAVQTIVRFAWPGQPYSSGDRSASDMLNTILGGSFTSRLNSNLREEHGYTYGAGSRFFMLPSTGYDIAVSRVRADVTGASLGEFLKEFKRIRSGDVTPEEHRKAASTVRTTRIRGSAGLGGILDQAEILVTNGLGFDDFDRSLADLGTVTQDQLNALAPRAVTPSDGVLVLVGDRDVILPQLDGLGLPTPTEHDVRGNPVMAEVEGP